MIETIIGLQECLSPWELNGEEAVAKKLERKISNWEIRRKSGFRGWGFYFGPSRETLVF